MAAKQRFLFKLVESVEEEEEEEVVVGLQQAGTGPVRANNQS